VNDDPSEQQRRDGGRSEPLDTVVAIETPEHVRFRYVLAGPARRAAAYGLDGFLRIIVLLVLVFIASLGGVDVDSSASELAGGALWLVAFVLEWGYFVLFETLWEGQSPGKRWMRLRVVSASGRPLGFVDSVLRNVLRAADFLPGLYVLGGAVMSVDARFRRLGDFVGGTLVVAEDPREVEAPLARIAPPTANELAQLPPAAALSPSELRVVELYLRRRPYLSDERSEELSQLAVNAVAGRHGIRLESSRRWLELLYLRATGGPRVRS
jgi:uncharacterized RDD family membrane protein YckC